MSSRRKRRPVGVRTAQGDGAAEPQLTPEEIEAAELAAEQEEADPATEARIAAEDAALEQAEDAVRDGVPVDTALGNLGTDDDAQEIPGVEPRFETAAEATAAKLEAIDAGEYERAAAIRDQERELQAPMAERPSGMDRHPSDAAEEFAEIGDDATEHWIGHVEPPIPDFGELFERGPLAAGIRTFEAMLNEARAGYVNAAVDELERVIDENFAPPERQFIGTVALENRTEAGLPDVAGAYRALIRIKAQQEQG